MVQRLSVGKNGHVIVELKSAYDDGIAHVVLSPMEFIGRLGSLVPRPGANLARFHAVFVRGGYSIEIEECEKCGGRVRVIA